MSLYYWQVSLIVMNIIKNGVIPFLLVLEKWCAGISVGKKPGWTRPRQYQPLGEEMKAHPVPAGSYCKTCHRYRYQPKRYQGEIAGGKTRDGRLGVYGRESGFYGRESSRRYWMKSGNHPRSGNTDSVRVNL